MPSTSLPAPPAGAGNQELQDYNVAPNAGSYTPTQLAAIDYTGGFHDLASLEQIIAIQQAETSGTPGDIVLGVGDGDYEYSVGMSAVNISSAPQQTGSPDLAPGLLLPITNAIAAYGISGGGQSWGAWSTYNAGAAQISGADVAAAESAVNNPTQASLTAHTLQDQFLSSISYDIPASGNLASGVTLATLTANEPVTPAQVAPTGGPNGGPGPASTAASSSGVAASTSSVYKALQSVNSWLNPAGQSSSTSNPAGLPSWLQDALGLLTAGTSTAASAAAGAASKATNPTSFLEALVSPFQMILVRGAFALPGVIGMLAAAAVGVLGSGLSDSAASALKVLPEGAAVEAATA